MYNPQMGSLLPVYQGVLTEERPVEGMMLDGDLPPKEVAEIVEYVLEVKVTDVCRWYGDQPYWSVYTLEL